MARSRKSLTSLATSGGRVIASLESKQQHQTTFHQKKRSDMPFLRLNKDTASVVASFLSCDDHASVLKANRFAYGIFKQPLIKKLFQAILDGDYLVVDSMLTLSPELLLEALAEKDTMVTLSGQRINNVTAYRTALAVEDIEMARMIKRVLRNLAGEGEVSRQYQQQFPCGWQMEEEKRWSPVFAQLDVVTLAIKEAKEKDIRSTGYPDYKLTVDDGTRVAEALARLGSLLSVLLNEKIITGRHFNPKLLIKAFSLYHEHYHDFFGGSSSHPRALLFWQRVIGMIQRALPVNDLQALCDGLDRAEKKLLHHQPQGRSLKCILSDVQTERIVPVLTDVYPLATSRLGIDYAMSGWRAREVIDGVSASRATFCRGWIASGVAMSGRSDFLTYRGVKQRLLSAMAKEHQNIADKTSFCVMM